MALFLWLIILLAIAWGLADFQLQSRVEHEPPPPPVAGLAPVEPPKDAVVAPAITEEPRSTASPAPSETTPDSAPSVAAQAVAPVRARAGRDEE